MLYRSKRITRVTYIKMNLHFYCLIRERAALYAKSYFCLAT